mgnify:CR=1 FL=1
MTSSATSDASQNPASHLLEQFPAEPKVAIVGLGYVGLPLAVAFSNHFDTIGFDINQHRISELKNGFDRTEEISKVQLLAAKRLRLSATLEELKTADIFIVTVPTPIDHSKQPDFTPLIQSSCALGTILKRGAIVIYESTVYPGATEEVCVPLLEQHSGLKFKEDFFVGYSPERINPGDQTHRVTDIVKVTAGCCPVSAKIIDQLYRRVITAGTHAASSIKVAEAAKVIENTQRDLNIALINELAMIFNRLDIDTHEVLAAASTKWNFLPFKPGLVGGHCIGVDPYYLTYKAQSIGYHPEIILAGRRINDNMPIYVAEQVIKLMTKKKLQVVDSNVLVLGLAFKENCPDIRNTKVIDLLRELKTYHSNVHVLDPCIDPAAAAHEYDLAVMTDWQELGPLQGQFDALILAVNHTVFAELSGEQLRKLVKPNGVIYDVKGNIDPSIVDGRL